MDIDLIDYLETEVPELAGRITAGYTKSLGKVSAVYFISPHTRDYVNESQLELRLVGAKYDEVKALEERIDDVLAFRSGDPFRIHGSTKFFSVRSGGGCLFREDLRLYENTLYYNIKWRTING